MTQKIQFRTRFSSLQSLILALTVTTSVIVSHSIAAPKIQKQSAQVADDDLAKMQKKYENVNSLTANFSQSQKNAALGRTKDSKGRIYIVRPNKFRWETFEPDASILTSNGKKFWFYTPPFQEGEKGQVMIRNAHDAQSKLAVDLLIGGSDFKKNFDYRRIEPLHYRLNPLKPAGDIDSIELFLENQTNLVYKLRLISASGNETTITLSQVELGPKLPESMFNFQVPPQTEVIK